MKYFNCIIECYVIEKATDSNQASENWGLILEVCDLINSSEDGPKDAIKAIRKRLQQNAGRNYKTVIFTLIVSTKISIA